MDNLPFVARFEEVDHPYALWDKRMCIWRDPDDLMQAFLIKSLMVNPFADLSALISSIQDQVSTNSTKEEFHAMVDVFQFKVEEITVKIGDDNSVTIEAKHDEKQDEHGFISRHFIRTYSIPPSCDVNDVYSKLSFDGILTIAAPKRQDVDHRENPFFQGEHSRSGTREERMKEEEKTGREVRAERLETAV